MSYNDNVARDSDATADAAVAQLRSTMTPTLDRDVKSDPPPAPTLNLVEADMTHPGDVADRTVEEVQRTQRTLEIAMAAIKSKTKVLNLTQRCVLTVLSLENYRDARFQDIALTIEDGLGADISNSTIREALADLVDTGFVHITGVASRKGRGKSAAVYRMTPKGKVAFLALPSLLLQADQRMAC